MGDATSTQFFSPTGYVVAATIEAVAWLAVVLLCLMWVRRGTAARVGLLGGVLAALAQAAYAVDGLLMIAHRPDSVEDLAGFIFSREHLPTLLQWAHTAGLVLVVVALVLSLRQSVRSRTP